MAAVVHYCAEITLPSAGDPGVSDFAADCSVDLNNWANRDLAGLKLFDSRMDQTVLMKKISELHETCHRADILDSDSELALVDLPLGSPRVLVPAKYHKLIRCGVLSKFHTRR